MTPKMAAEIKAQALKIEEEWPGSSPMIRNMQAYWKENRPKMWKRLRRLGLLRAYPKVLEEYVRVRASELRKQGNFSADSQAAMEVLGDLMVPESWEEEELEEMDDETKMRRGLL